MLLFLLDFANSRPICVLCSAHILRDVGDNDDDDKTSTRNNAVMQFKVLYFNIQPLTLKRVRHRTCDSQVAGSSPGWAPLCSGLGQAILLCVCHQAI